MASSYIFIFCDRVCLFILVTLKKVGICGALAYLAVSKERRDQTENKLRIFLDVSSEKRLFLSFKRDLVNIPIKNKISQYGPHGFNLFELSM